MDLRSCNFYFYYIDIAVSSMLINKRLPNMEPRDQKKPMATLIAMRREGIDVDVIKHICSLNFFYLSRHL